MAMLDDSPPGVKPVPVLVQAELHGAEAPPDPALQRDTEARLEIIQNILDQWHLGQASWREAAVRVKAMSLRLPERMRGDL